MGIHDPPQTRQIKMRTIELPPLEVLLDRFEYNPDTGELLYRKATPKRLESGLIAGYDNGRGWLRVKVGDRHYRVARIVWKMYYGEDPPEGMHIDHINRDRSDNRIKNLRTVTYSENIKNSIRVINAKGASPKKTPEELRIIRNQIAEKNKKPVFVIKPNGEETYYPSIKEAAEANNLTSGGISNLLNGRAKTYRGFTARYAD